jgi:O-antigen ligase
VSTDRDLEYGIENQSLDQRFDPVAAELEVEPNLHDHAKVGRATYLGVMAFSIIYFGRPEDWIPGISFIPWAKLSGVIALVAFLGSLVTGRKMRFPKELRILLALFFILCVSVPFSTWVGGSFNLILTEFSKVVLITIVLVQAGNTQFRLRRLILVQTVAVIIVSAVSLHANVRDTGRVTGALNGGFLNPNDLAQNISLVFPFTLMFLARANGVRKVFWFMALGVLGYALTQTYSRGGFLAMSVATVGGFIWAGPKVKRPLMVLIVFGIVFVLISPSGGHLIDRVSSIWTPAKDETGSFEARQELLTRSLELTAQHPLLGIGPGQFQVLSGNWHVAHNSYTEFAAEAGVLALLLFLWMLVCTFTRLRKAYKKSAFDYEARLLSSALLASLLALIASMFFASSQYLILPYFIVGYCLCFALNAAAELPAPVEDSLQTLELETEN